MTYQPPEWKAGLAREGQASPVCHKLLSVFLNFLKFTFFCSPLLVATSQESARQGVNSQGGGKVLVPMTLKL